MKVAVLSDAHLDLNSIHSGENLLPILIDSLKKKEPDLIIISGDLSNYAKDSLKIIDVIEEQLGVKVLFIPGNHDIFVNRDQSSWESYILFAEHHSTLIDKPHHINDEYVVIGDMGWYDYSFAPTIPFYKLKSKKKSLWADGKYAHWNMEDSDLMNKMMDKFQKQLEENKHKKVIFVNHFVPYKDFISYRSDNDWNLTNAYMGTENLGWLLDQYKNIDYVLFGHSHNRFGKIEDFKNKTLICNPIGYVDEWETDDFTTELEKTITVFEIH